MLTLLLLSACVTFCTAVPSLKFVSYLPLPDGQGRLQPFLGTADRMAFDEQENYLYVVGRKAETLHVIDMSNHSNPQIIHTTKFSEVTHGIPTAIDFCRSAQRQEFVISFSARERLLEGHVETFRAFLRSDPTLHFIRREPTSPDPTAVKYEKLCGHFVVACAGLPGSPHGSFRDPYAHVDIFQPEVDGYTRIPINFEGAQGLSEARFIYKNPHDHAHDVRSDLNPTDIVIDKDNTVYVTFFENNVVAKFDLYAASTASSITFYNMGSKDWSNYYIDSSDSDQAQSPHNDKINLVHRNIRSFNQPKRLDLLYHNNYTFLLTANTGGRKVYTAAADGVDFVEGSRGRDIQSQLLGSEIDSATKAELSDNSKLGRLWFTDVQGDPDCWDTVFGVYKHMCAFGGRGWSIFRTDTVTQVYDSRGDLEYEVAQHQRPIFNTDCITGNDSPVKRVDTRSDDMGPEPNAIANGIFANKPVVVVGSGRMGGLWLYNIEEGDTAIKPTAYFRSYTRLGDTSDSWSHLYSNNKAGISYISDLKITEHGGHVDVFVLGSQMGAVAVFEIEENISR